MYVFNSLPPQQHCKYFRFFGFFVFISFLFHSPRRTKQEKTDSCFPPCCIIREEETIEIFTETLKVDIFCGVETAGRGGRGGTKNEKRGMATCLLFSS